MRARRKKWDLAKAESQKEEPKKNKMRDDNRKYLNLSVVNRFAINM